MLRLKYKPWTLGKLTLSEIIDSLVANPGMVFIGPKQKEVYVLLNGSNREALKFTGNFKKMNDKEIMEFLAKKINSVLDIVV
jgi:hypothetical protein